MICQQLTPERFGFVLALFYHRQLRLFNFTGHWLLTTILPSHAPRRNQRGQVVRRPSPTGYCLTPTANCQRQNGVQSRRTAPLLSISPNQAIPAEKSIRCSLLAAVGPLTILSWPEALNASRSKRAPEAIRRNACSLLALPDFLEFAQAVRYGVPGTPLATARLAGCIRTTSCRARR